MQDTMNLVMLICAAVAALAFGVLAAHLLCRVAFTALRIHARSVTPERVINAETAPLQQSA